MQPQYDEYYYQKKLELSKKNDSDLDIKLDQNGNSKLQKIDFIIETESGVKQIIKDVAPQTTLKQLLENRMHLFHKLHKGLIKVSINQNTFIYQTQKNETLLKLSKGRLFKKGLKQVNHIFLRAKVNITQRDQILMSFIHQSFSKQQKKLQQLINEPKAIFQLKQKSFLEQLKKKIFYTKSYKCFCKDIKNHFRKSSILNLLFIKKDGYLSERNNNQRQIILNSEKYLRQSRKLADLDRLLQISEDPTLKLTKFRIDLKEVLNEIKKVIFIRQINQAAFDLIQRIQDKHQLLIQSSIYKKLNQRNDFTNSSYLGMNTFKEYIKGNLSDYKLDEINDKVFAQVIQILKTIFLSQIYDQLEIFKIERPFIKIENNELIIQNSTKSIVRLQSYQMQKIKLINKKIKKPTEEKESFSLMVDPKALSSSSISIRIISTGQEFGHRWKSPLVIDHSYNRFNQLCVSQKVKEQIYKVKPKSKLYQNNPAIIVDQFNNLGHQKIFLGHLYQIIRELGYINDQNSLKAIFIQDGDVRLKREHIQQIQSVITAQGQSWTKISFVQDKQMQSKLLSQRWIKCYTPVTVTQMDKIIRNGIPFLRQLEPRQFVTEQGDAKFLLSQQEMSTQEQQKLQSLIEVFIDPELILRKEFHFKESQMKKIQTIIIASKSARSKIQKLEQKKINAKDLQFTFEDNCRFLNGAVITSVLARMAGKQLSYYLKQQTSKPKIKKLKFTPDITTRAWKQNKYKQSNANKNICIYQANGFSEWLCSAQDFIFDDQCVFTIKLHQVSISQYIKGSSIFVGLMESDKKMKNWNETKKHCVYLNIAYQYIYRPNEEQTDYQWINCSCQPVLLQFPCLIQCHLNYNQKTITWHYDGKVQATSSMPKSWEDGIKLCAIVSLQNQGDSVEFK